MADSVARGCLPFLVASADDQGTMRFKICDVDAFVGTETQRDRVNRLLAADLAIADDGSFVELTDGLLANELKNLYNQLNKIDPSGRRIVYAVSNVPGPTGSPVYRVSYILYGGGAGVVPAVPPPPPIPTTPPPPPERTLMPPPTPPQSDSTAPPEPRHHRSFRGSLVSLFASPTKLRTTLPRPKKLRSRHSHGTDEREYTTSPAVNTESPARASTASLEPASASRSIPDIRGFINTNNNASPSNADATAFTADASPSLLSPAYIPGSTAGVSARASAISLSPPRPPSSFPTHLSTKSTSSLGVRPSSSSLVQSPFEHPATATGSNVHPLSNAPDELYHKVRKPAPREYRQTGPRPSNGSLRTNASMDSTGSTIRDSYGGQGHESSITAHDQSYKHTSTGGSGGAHLPGTHSSTTVMPRFESLCPMFDREQSPVHLVAGPTETTWVGLYIPSDHAFASPNDDPRFVMYGKSLTELIPFKGKYTPDMSRLAFTTSRFADGTGRPYRDSVSTAADGAGSAKGTAGTSSMAPSSDTLNTEMTTPFTNFDKPAILAATIERWVAQLTSQLDYEELLKFFYTYRSYISPFDLLHILIYRFQWTLTPSGDDTIAPEGVQVEKELTHWMEDGAIKRIVRARTCVVLRYWLSTFFVVDFLRNRRLGLMMTNWLNVVSRSHLLDKLPDAKAMLGLVKDLVRQSKIIYYEEGRAATPPEDRMVGTWDGNSVPLSPHLLDMSPVLEQLIAEDDPSKTDPRNPDVDLDFTLPLPQVDHAHLKPSDDGYHDPDSDVPAPPPLSPYQRAFLRVGLGAPTIPGQIVSSMIPHSGRLTIQQANAMSPLHIADPGTINPHATSAETGTSYVYTGGMRHSKVERAMVNTLGRLSQWRNMLNPRSPFTSHPIKIEGQLSGPGVTLGGRTSGVGSSGNTLAVPGMSVVARGFARSRNNAVANAGGALMSGSLVRLPPTNNHTPQKRSPLRSLSISNGEGEPVKEEDEPAEGGEGRSDIPTIDVQAPVVDEEPVAEEPAAPSTETPAQVAFPTAADEPAVAAPQTHPVPIDHDTDADAEPDDDDDEDDYGVPHTAPTFALRHPAPFDHMNAAPLSAIDHSRVDFRDRDSTASWRSSVSSFGVLLPRRSISEALKPPPGLAPPGLGHGPPGLGQTPSTPPGLPPGLEEFIEAEGYSSSESEADEDEEGGKDKPSPPSKSNASAGPSTGQSTSKMSLRREYRLAEEAAQREAAVKAERVAAGKEEDSDDDAPLLAPDAKYGAWHFQPIHKDGDDDPEAGDKEAALRRLEGAVDPEVARAKQEKLDAMIKRAKERARKEDAGEDFSQDDRAAEEAFLAWVAATGGDGEDAEDTVEAPATEAPTSTEPPATSTTERVDEDDAHPLPPVPPEGQEEEKAPIFTPEFPAPQGLTSSLERFPPPGPQSGWLPSYEIPGPQDPPVLTHKRSWIMDYRSDTLARHFSIIDRDLLTNLHFDQIVSLEWARTVSEITVYDWEWFIKWDTRRKAALQEAPYRNLPTISSLSACRARFNLVLMWTATEIVLTPSGDRPGLVDKFIRLAQKLHQQNNFASLVAIMLGLQSAPVARAMRRHWHRIAAWESRILKELMVFTAPAGNYRKVREAIHQLAARRWSVPQATVQTTDRDGQTVLENAKPSCIPFIQAYLGELHDHSLLPDFIDPTACDKPYYSSGKPLDNPGVFAPLPPLPAEVPLRPHVNVGKQRLIADVVRDVVAGQQLALNYTLADLDGKVFIKCMTLKALAPEQLDELTEKM